MSYKGVIFDLDGTLINSITDIGNSLNNVLRKYDLKTSTLEEYTKRIGEGLYQLMLDSIPKDTSENMKANIYTDFLEEYSNNYLVKTKPYTDIVELINTLAENKIKLAVNSNKNDAFTKDIVKTIFSGIEFVAVIGDRKGVNKKPDPFSANEIISKMQLPKEAVIYIGDTIHDINTAINADIDSIGVSWGYRDLEVLKAQGAKYTVNQPLEILKIVL